MVKSITASPMFSFAASWTPRMFSPTSSQVKTIPTMMSHGFVRSGPQKIDR